MSDTNPELDDQLDASAIAERDRGDAIEHHLAEITQTGVSYDRDS